MYCKWGNVGHTIEEILNSIKVEEGPVATSYSPYGQGCVEINKINKSFVDLIGKLFSDAGCTTSNSTADSFTVNSTGAWARVGIQHINNLPKNKDYVVSATLLETVLNQSVVGFSILGNDEDDFGTSTEFITVSNTKVTIDKNEATKISTQFNTGNYPYIFIRLWTNCTANTVNSTINVSDFMIEENTVATDYVEHQEVDYTLDIQQPMLKGDYFVKEDDVWK